MKLIRFIRKPIKLVHLQGKRVAVDLYSWLHKVMTSDRNYRKYVIYRQSSGILRTICTYVAQLARVCTSIIIIADGNNLPGKLIVNEKRGRVDVLNAKFAALRELLVANDYIFDWKSAEGKQVDELAAAISHSIPHLLFREVRDAILQLGLPNVDFRVAAYECDHQVIKLFEDNLIDVIIGKDSDYLLNGARVLISDFHVSKGRFSGYVWDMSLLLSEARRVLALPVESGTKELSSHYGKQKPAAKLASAKASLAFLQMFVACPDMLLDFAILSGNDYGKPKGLGWSKALAVIKLARRDSSQLSRLRPGALSHQDLPALADAVTVVMCSRAQSSKSTKTKLKQQSSAAILSVLQKAFFCFRAATVTDWERLSQQPLQVELVHHIPADVQSFLGYRDLNQEKIFRDSLGDGEYSRFVFHAYPEFTIPENRRPTPISDMSAPELALFIRARGVQVPRGGMVKTKPLAELMNALDAKFPHAFIFHYPELLREGATLSARAAEAAELGGKKRKTTTGGEQPVLTKKERVALFQDQWVRLGNTEGTWRSDDAFLSLLLPEVTNDALQSWFSLDWSQVVLNEGQVGRSLNKGTQNTKQRDIDIELLYLPTLAEAEQCQDPECDEAHDAVLVRAGMPHSFNSESKGFLRTCVKVLPKK